MSSVQMYPISMLDYRFSQEEILTLLLLIEQTRPEDIISPGQLLQIGPYSFAQARVAIAQQAIQYTLPDKLVMLRARSAQKDLSHGRKAQLFVRYPSSEQANLPKTINLTISDTSCYILEFEFPILEPKDGWDAASIRFADFRQRPHRLTFLSDMQNKGTTLEDIQHLWAGLRFLCRNLREWDRNDITWPEDI